MKWYLSFLLSIACLSLQAQTPLIDCMSGNCALLDSKTFRPITPYRYAYIEPFVGGRAVASWRSAGKTFYAHIDEKGRELLSPTENQLFALINGRIIYRDKQTKLFGYLDSLGDVRVQARFKRCANYSEGLAYVEEEKPNDSERTRRRAFIDLEGYTAFEIPSGYTLLDEHFRQGVIRVMVSVPPRAYTPRKEQENWFEEKEEEETKTAYFREPASPEFWDKTGRAVFRLQDLYEGLKFENDLPTAQGYYTVRIDHPHVDTGKMGVLDKEGKWIIPLGEGDLSFKNGVFVLETGYPVYNKTVYDETGKMLLTTSSSVLWRAGKGWVAGKRADGNKYVYHYIDAAGKTFPILFQDVWAMPNGDLLGLPSENKNSSKYYLYAPDGTAKDSSTLHGFYQVWLEEGTKAYEEQTFVRLQWGNRWALARTKGKEIITDWQDKIANFLAPPKPELIAMRKGTSWRLVGKDWEHAHAFEGDFSAVKRGKWAIIHRSGNLSTAFVYDSIAPLVRLSRRYAPEDTHSEYTYGALEAFATKTIPLSWLGLPHHQFLACQQKKWGVIDGLGRVIVPLVYDAIEDATPDHLQAVVNKKRVWVDYTGKELFPPQPLEYPLYAPNGLVYAKMPEGLKILSEGAFLNLPACDSVAVFAGGMDKWLTRKDKKWGLMDASGTEILPNAYTKIQMLGSWLGRRAGFANQDAIKHYTILEQDGKLGLAYDFKPITPCKYKRISDDMGRLDYFDVADENAWGLIDADGREIFPCHYSDITRVHGWKKHCFFAQKGGKIGLFSQTGKAITPLDYNHLYFLESQRFGGETLGMSGWQGNKQLVLDSAGRALKTLVWDEVADMESLDEETRNTDFWHREVGDGWRVKKNGRWGWVDGLGKLRLACEYDEIQPVRDNYYLLRKGKRWGIAAPTGDLIAPCIYDDIETAGEEMPRGYMAGKRKGKWIQISLKNTRQ